VEIHPHPWTRLQVCTAQEDHGSGRRLIRVRSRLRQTPFGRSVAFLGLAACGLLASIHAFAAVVPFDNGLRDFLRQSLDAGSEGRGAGTG
jgi:hypothetical protein